MKYLTLVLTAIFGFLFVFSWNKYHKDIQNLTEEVIEQSVQETDLVAELLFEELSLLERVVDSLIEAKLPETNTLEQVKTFEQVLDRWMEVYGLGIIYQNPPSPDPSLYLSRSIEGFNYLREDSTLQKEEQRWLTTLLEKGTRSGWGDSLMVKGSRRTRSIQYGKVFTLDNGEKGALFIQLSMREIQQIVSKANLGQAGYGFVLSRKGKLIHHPVTQWLVEERSIFDVGYGKINTELKTAIDRVNQGEKELIEFVNPQNNQSSWLFFEPIEGTNWIMGVTFFKEELVNNVVERRKNKILLCTWLVLFISCLIISLRLWVWPTAPIWYFIGASSVSLLFGILYVINISFNKPILMGFDLEQDDLKITDEGVLNHFKEINDSLYKTYLEDSSIYIPTGVYIEHAKFEESHMVMVSGYVWQEYHLDRHKGIERGFIFPEADPNAEFVEIQEAYREFRDDREIIGWYFQVALRKKYNYTFYPFDWQNIRLKIAHVDFLHHVLPVPDLASYRLMNPASLPGVKAEIEMPGWQVKQSYFTIKKIPFNTTFGVRPMAGLSQYPEFAYNVLIKRVFVGPFVSSVFTILIIISLLFVAQIIEFNKKQKKSGTIVTGSLGIIELSAAFFFVLILGHTSLREQLSVEELIYIDYFYFASYFMILITCLNFMMDKKEDNKEHKKDRIISKEWLKVYYWPIILGLFYLVSALVFY